MSILVKTHEFVKNTTKYMQMVLLGEEVYITKYGMVAYILKEARKVDAGFNEDYEMLQQREGILPDKSNIHLDQAKEWLNKQQQKKNNFNGELERVPVEEM